MNFRHEVKYFEEHGELDPDAEYDRMREDRDGGQDLIREDEAEEDREMQRETYAPKDGR